METGETINRLGQLWGYFGRCGFSESTYQPALTCHDKCSGSKQYLIQNALHCLTLSHEYREKVWQKNVTYIREESLSMPDAASGQIMIIQSHKRQKLASGKGNNDQTLTPAAEVVEEVEVNEFNRHPISLTISTGFQQRYLHRRLQLEPNSCHGTVRHSAMLGIISQHGRYDDWE